MENFKSYFGRADEPMVFSAPGRTEIGGNHTDHQHGKVLAAAIDLDTKAAAAPNDRGLIRIKSEGYDYLEVSLDCLEPIAAEYETTASLVRGIAARITQTGHAVKGFDAYITSDVLPGSGLSSSAAFEVLIGNIINELGNCALTPVEIARIGQYAENKYFGKPSGLMDQMASSVGNMITIDFEDNDSPKIRPVNVDFSAFGYSLCIIDSGADHADLTCEYAAITSELKKVCSVFGKNYLREVDEDEFYANLAAVRRTAGDRGVLRAMHFYDENKRVDGEVKALEEGSFNEFLRLVNESGISSWTLLQNIFPTGSTTRQEVGVALALCRRALKGYGAFRVHGGGFAGTVQAFVPNEMLEAFKSEIEEFLGSGSCRVLNIRREGGRRER